MTREQTIRELVQARELMGDRRFMLDPEKAQRLIYALGIVLVRGHESLEISIRSHLQETIRRAELCSLMVATEPEAQYEQA